MKKSIYLHFAAPAYPFQVQYKITNAVPISSTIFSTELLAAPRQCNSPYSPTSAEEQTLSLTPMPAFVGFMFK